MKQIEYNGNIYEYFAKPCPFCGRDPKIELEVRQNYNWEGRSWAWLRCDCRVKQHMGVHHDQRWQVWNSNEWYEGMTEKQALQEALTDLCTDWNKRAYETN